MATVKPQLVLRQGQALVMTPQLQQSIKLLQLGAQELQAFVEEQLESNPLLERDEGEAATEGEGEAGEEAADAGFATDEAINRLEASGPEAAGLDLAPEAMWEADSAPGDLGHWARAGAPVGDEELDRIEQTASGGPTLREHLLSQLRVACTDPTDLLIGSRLIELIDESGYLPESLDHVAVQLGCEPARIDRALAILQRFEPTGVFARSLKECLALQLAEKNRLDPLMSAFLDNLDLLAARDFDALRARCGISHEDLADMIAEIRRLEPKPGREFGIEAAPTVVPDIFIRPGPEGAWLVELNPDTMPRVIVNTAYFSLLTKGVRSPAEHQFLTQQMQSANWLVRSLVQRSRTIMNVAQTMVGLQSGFFANGVRDMRPMTLRDIAAIAEVHESTVSRVVANKYLACPRGVFELKFFFTSALQSNAGGDAHAAEAVRHRIKAMIDAESPDRILSDDHIAASLSRSGIAIARRTVAKYRESLRIPSSVERRRLKRSGLREIEITI
ncbi:MAG: RNA polymerase factor sigma-54 [Alphaproteobacteria bacterium]